jgi:hypothetical protein
MECYCYILYTALQIAACHAHYFLCLENRYFYECVLLSKKIRTVDHQWHIACCHSTELLDWQNWCQPVVTYTTFYVRWLLIILRTHVVLLSKISDSCNLTSDSAYCNYVGVLVTLPSLVLWKFVYLFVFLALQPMVVVFSQPGSGL